MKSALPASVLTLAAALAACSAPGFDREAPAPARAVEAEVPPQAMTTGAGEKTPPPPPPTAEEIAGAVVRAFRDVVRVDVTSGHGHVAADFNGDGSQDLAVAVKQVPDRLGEINDDLANWIIQDPLAAAPAGPGAAGGAVPPPGARRVRVEAGDPLLAVIPGYGPAGWRNEEARHGYLLRNAVGAEMESLPLERLMSAGPGKTFAGEAIVETIGTRRGFLYWTGTKYAWRDRGDPGD